MPRGMKLRETNSHKLFTTMQGPTYSQRPQRPQRPQGGQGGQGWQGGQGGRAPPVQRAQQVYASGPAYVAPMSEAFKKRQALAKLAKKQVEAKAAGILLPSGEGDARPLCPFEAKGKLHIECLDEACWKRGLYRHRLRMREVCSYNAKCRIGKCLLVHDRLARKENFAEYLAKRQSRDMQGGQDEYNRRCAMQDRVNQESLQPCRFGLRCSSVRCKQVHPKDFPGACPKQHHCQFQRALFSPSDGQGAAGKAAGKVAAGKVAAGKAAGKVAAGKVAAGKEECLMNHPRFKLAGFCDNCGLLATISQDGISLGCSH